MNIGGVDFNVIGKLGSGSYGDVYEVEKDGKRHALKVIENSSKEGIKSLRELDIMGRLEHPNLMNAEAIVSEYDDEKKISRVGILMEKAERDMYDAMYDTSFSIESRLEVLFSITQGLEFLHNSGYLHLDLKPLNILIFPNNVGKLTDFGLSVKLENINDKYVKHYPKKLITVDHRPMNIINGSKNYTPEDDIFSLGLIYLEVLSGGRSLFSKLKSKEFKGKTIKKIYKEKIGPKVIKKTLKKYLADLPKQIRKNAINTIIPMLFFKPLLRPSLDLILSSQLFSSFQRTNLGKVKEPYIEKPICSVLDYKGFDIITKISRQIDVNIETFFLAIDIYQRSISMRKNTDYKNVLFNAILAFYMAIKMIESYFADGKKLIELSGNYFKHKKLIIGESILVNNWQGIIYPDNLFTSSSTLTRLKQSFILSRNCFIYRTIDLETWKKYNDEEEIKEGKFEKYSHFNNFFVTTSYYEIMTEDPSLSYISKLYKEDLKL